jgi:glyceraldehyde 3-phosphate dehydrogenase
MRVAINGFGRIGRCVARLLRDQDSIELVAINDPGDHGQLVHLLRFDSTHGVIDGVHQDGDTLRVGRQSARLFGERDPKVLPWGELEIDLVIEASGHFAQRDLAAGHLEAGARRVLVSAPCGGADRTIVFGVNHDQIQSADSVLSAASCTTNCLSPIVAALDQAYGILGGVMTTIHAVTNDQRLLDLPHPKDRRRARSALNNIIPTSTGAARALKLVFPEADWAIDGLSVRVPVLDVSLVDLAVRTKVQPQAAEVQELFRDLATRRAFDGTLAVSADERVSTDFLGHPASSIVDLPLIATASDGMLRVVSWYDNEWGFSSRVVDIALYLKVMESRA